MTELEPISTISQDVSTVEENEALPEKLKEARENTELLSDLLATLNEAAGESAVPTEEVIESIFSQH